MTTNLIESKRTKVDEKRRFQKILNNFKSQVIKARQDISVLMINLNQEQWF
jgi:hypothetical protein